MQPVWRASVGVLTQDQETVGIPGECMYINCYCIEWSACQGLLSLHACMIASELTISLATIRLT